MHPEPGWYCICCVSRREYALELRLLKAGFDCLVPREIYWVLAKGPDKRKHPGEKWASRDRALFPRLVFVNMQHERDWQRIRLLPFVQGALALRVDDRYYKLSDDDVKILQSMNGTTTSPPTSTKSLKAGDKAKVSIGALAGHACEIQTVAGKRAKVLLMLLGSMKTVDIPLTSLEAV